ncbi:hypothetical protein, partial [Pseudomonas sp. 2822-15]|uniref:hypothetical protein n=1 Tax=Pseudomonas sp. 2822-15 TaxID=1712677 RepID=UPI001C449F1B
YNALTTPSFFQNELLKVHEFMLVDDDIVRSPFYDKQYVLLSQAEMERIQHLENEINNLKQREKLLENEKMNAEKANR